MLTFIIGFAIGGIVTALVVRALDLAGTEAVLRGHFGW